MVSATTRCRVVVFSMILQKKGDVSKSYSEPMAVVLICDWIVTQPFCLACMEPISVNMEGPPAVGHASPASSVGEADPHLVSVFHIACMPFLLPPQPPNTFWWLSADCVLMWGLWGVGWKSEHSFYIRPLPCYCTFYPRSPEKRCID